VLEVSAVEGPGGSLGAHGQEECGDAAGGGGGGPWEDRQNAKHARPAFDQVAQPADVESKWQASDEPPVQAADLRRYNGPAWRTELAGIGDSIGRLFRSSPAANGGITFFVATAAVNPLQLGLPPLGEPSAVTEDHRAIGPPCSPYRRAW
jgi:hypothetical protein